MERVEVAAMYHHQYPGKRPRNKQEISTDGPSMPLRTRLTSLTSYSVTGFVSGMRYQDPLTDKEMRRYRLAAARSCGPTYSTRARHQGSPCSEDVYTTHSSPRVHPAVREEEVEVAPVRDNHELQEMIHR